MAKVRIGFSTQFELENELVGIGTDNPTNTLQALGNIHATNAKAVGVSTFTTFDGFVDTKAAISGAGGAKSGATSGEIIIEGDVTVSSGTTFTSGPENLTVTDNFTLPGISDDKPSVGTTRFNENLAALEFYTGVEWRAVNSYVDNGNRGRGVFGGGLGPASPWPITKSIEYVNIVSQGNTQNFGNLTGTHRGWVSAFSSEIRGIWNSGSDYSGSNKSAILDYVTIASEGDAIDFGDPTFNSFSKASCSSSTRGVSAGGWTSPSEVNVNTIEYVEISTLGNAIDFGDLATTTRGMGATGSPTRGVFAGGKQTNNTADISFVTISSVGNAVRFGDLTTARRMDGGGQVSNSVRGLFWNSGSGSGPAIDYVTIASEGNAVFFADGREQTNDQFCTSNRIRGVFAGGSGPVTNTIQYVTISTTGQIEDFGDLSTVRIAAGGCSDSHGGLGGF